MAEEKPNAPPVTVPRGRCRCGHYPSQHMVTRAIAGSSNYRLDAGGPCSVCGEASCRTYTAEGSGSPSR